MDRRYFWRTGHRVFLKAFKVSLFTFCQWIETTSISTAIREGALIYPILGGFHLASIGWFGGMVLMGDLSVLGIGLPDAPVAELLSQFRRWKWLGFAIAFVSGALLWWSEPIVCYKSISFRIKLVLLALVGVNALFLRKEVYRNLAADLGAVKSRGARLGACISLLLWVALVFTGRGIAFF
jgi:hypothetical protein